MDYPSLPNVSDANDYSNISSNLDLSQDGTKRRSSSRSIKRRRFDDELVEYSLGIPGASMGSKVDRRVRTQSYTSPYSEMLGATAAQSTAPSPSTVSTPEITKRRPSGKPPSAGSKRPKRRGQLSQLSTKDLGRWKPADDLALIIGVQQTNDLRTVHRGIKFTCRFTVAELQSRWYALLYNAEVSRLAVCAMRNLHPELVAAVKAKALYSVAEEELLGSIPSNGQPTLEKFEELLQQNKEVFYSARTAKALMAHWQLMKQYQLLPDQTVQPLPKGENVLSFSDAEDTINDTELQDPRDEAVDRERHLADRIEKKEIRLLENSLSRWQVLVQSVVGGAGAELDKHTLAVLRGRLVRYLVRSREVIVGRSTQDQTVDIDLTLEGPAAKVSRRQATVRLRNNGDFFMSSEGKRPIFVDGRPILRGNKVKLNHNGMIEIAGLRFVFLVNQDLINNMRQDAVKVTIQT